MAFNDTDLGIAGYDRPLRVLLRGATAVPGWTARHPRCLYLPGYLLPLSIRRIELIQVPIRERHSRADRHIMLAAAA